MSTTPKLNGDVDAPEFKGDNLALESEGLLALGEGDRLRDEDADTDITKTTIPNHIIVRFCVSHFLSAWNSRFFEVGSVLFLASIYPNTLLPVSIYALVRALAAICLSPAVGLFVDAGERLSVVRISIVGERFAVAISCAMFLVLLGYGDGVSWLDHGLFACIVLLSGVEKLCSIMNSVSVTRDWMVELTQGNEDARRDLNAKIRRIDLSCKLLGPFLVASIDQVSTKAAIWVTFTMTLMSTFIEYNFIKRVYQSVPKLHYRKETAQSDSSGDTLLGQSTVRIRSSTATVGRYVLSAAQRIFPVSSIALYTRHRAFLPSLAYAFLHLTVLSFSGRMIAFLLAKGYGSLNVGIARTISTVAELSTTWISPRVTKRIGVVRSGLLSISWQTAWLTIGVACFLTDGRFALEGLIIGVIFSRVGLWGVDLAVQNIVQDEIESDDRGSFSTAEASVQNIFELVSYITTIVFPLSSQFQWPVLATMISLYAGCTVFWIYACHQRS